MAGDSLLAVMQLAERLRTDKTELARWAYIAKAEGHSLRAIADAAGSDRMTISRMIDRYAESP